MCDYFDTAVETVEHNGYTIKIKPDDSPENPRQFANIFTFCFDHGRYNMPWEFEVDRRYLTLRKRVWWRDTLHEGDRLVYDNSRWIWMDDQEPRSWTEVAEAIRQRLKSEGDDIAVWSQVYMLDHGSQHFSVPDILGRDPFNHLYMGMDSGCIGIAFISRKKVQKEYGWKIITPQRRAKLVEYLKNEVETYDQWANGDVYGYVIEDEDGEHIDSCWGYYGTESAIEAAKEACPDPMMVGEPEI